MLNPGLKEGELPERFLPLTPSCHILEVSAVGFDTVLQRQGHQVRPGRLELAHPVPVNLAPSEDDALEA